MHSGKEEAKMLLKAGVDISRLERNTRRGLAVVAEIFTARGREIVITSTYEGNHGDGSLHYANQAFDVRMPLGEAVTITAEITEALGKDFDVCFESDHIHIEYDPK